MNAKITIKKTQHTDGTRAVYRGSEIIGTISGAKPTIANGRADTWAFCRISGRVEWFGKYSDARDTALKG